MHKVLLLIVLAQPDHSIEQEINIIDSVEHHDPSIIHVRMVVIYQAGGCTQLHSTQTRNV